MQPLTRDDLLSLERYEAEREAFRRQVIGLKQARRISVGPRLTFLFENRITVLFQVQEMLRAERITRPEAIRDELDVYNVLLPTERELSATLFIEIDDVAQIKPELDRFFGIDDPGHVWLQVGPAERVVGLFEPGHSKEDKIAAVHYVRFALTPDQRELLLRAKLPVSLVVEHGKYRHRTTLSSVMIDSLRGDLAA